MGAGEVGALFVFLGFLSSLAAVMMFTDLFYSNPEECRTKKCAQDGINKGLQTIVLSISAFFLFLFGGLFGGNLDSEKIIKGITGAGLLTFGITSYSLYKWHAYRERYKELLLQEAIAKGVEIGMKKAKGTS
jgi:hypothetical protein